MTNIGLQFSGLQCDSQLCTIIDFLSIFQLTYTQKLIELINLIAETQVLCLACRCTCEHIIYMYKCGANHRHHV